MNTQAQELFKKSYGTDRLIFPRNGVINGRRFDVLISLGAMEGIAHASGRLDRIEERVETRETPQLVSGQWVMQEDLVAVCAVYRRDWSQPLISEIKLSEFQRKDRKGRPTVQWREHQEELLRRIARATSLRKAFAVSCLYIPEEVGVGMMVGDRLVQDREESMPVISPAQVEGLMSQFTELRVNVPAFCAYFGVLSVEDLPVSRYREAMGLLSRKRQRQAQGGTNQEALRQAV